MESFVPGVTVLRLLPGLDARFPTFFITACVYAFAPHATGTAKGSLAHSSLSRQPAKREKGVRSHSR